MSERLSFPTYSLSSHVMRQRTPLGCAAYLTGRVIVVAALIGLLIIAFVRAISPAANAVSVAINFPYPLNYGEGPLLDQAVRLARGENLYRANLSSPPYLITNYPPLYVMAQAPFVNTYGAAFWYGRLISVISALGASVSLGMIAHLITRSRVAGIVAGISLLTIPYIAFWSSLARIDPLALALSLIGLLCVVSKPERDRSLVLAAIFFTAAAYTRQTYLLAAPLAGFAFLWGKGLRNRAFMLIVGLAALVLALFIPLMIATRGGIFFHLITANVNAIDPTLISHYADELGRNLFIFLIGAGLFILLGWIGRNYRAAWWLASAYALGAVGSALTISKVGSDVNYLFELSAALCLCFAALIAWAGRVPLFKTALLIAAAAQIVIASDLLTGKYLPILLDRIDERRAGIARLEQVIIETDAPILADEQIGLLALYSRPIIIQPFEMSQLATASVWDQTQFLRALERGDYPVVLIYQPMRNPSLRFERWTRDMLQTIYMHYRVGFQAAETTVYRFIE